MNIDPKQRAKAIDAAIASIERQFGKGSIMRMDEKVDTKMHGEQVFENCIRILPKLCPDLDVEKYD